MVYDITERRQFKDPENVGGYLKAVPAATRLV